MQLNNQFKPVRSYGIGMSFPILKINEKLSITTGGVLYFGARSVVTDSLYYLPNNQFAQLVEVTRKGLTFRANLEANYYFIGDPEVEFGVYGFAGFGIFRTWLKTKEIDNYDQNAMRLLTNTSVGETVVSDYTMLSLGVGGEYQVTDYVAAFADLRLINPRGSFGSADDIYIKRYKNSFTFEFGLCIKML